MKSSVFAKILIGIVCVFLSSCSKFNPIAPSEFSGGPEIWLHPNVGVADYQRLFTNEDEWSQARKKVKVFQFHHANTMSGDSCWGCTTIDGRTNSLSNISGAGAFKKLSQWGIPVSVEVGSLKHFNCENFERDAYMTLDPTLASIANLRSAGAVVSHLSMDEPFMGGMIRADWNGKDISGCEFSPEKTAQLTVDYWIRPVLSAYPGIQIGLTEGYPTANVEVIKKTVIAMEQAGYKLPFLHIDMDRYGAIGGNFNPDNDIREIRDFVKSRGITFGLIVWGESGKSSESWYADAMAMATRFRNAVGGDVDRIIIESWSRLGDPYGAQLYYPELLPESKPGTMTYMVNQMSSYFR